MKDILDAPEEKPKKSIFAILSFASLMGILCLFTYLSTFVIDDEVLVSETVIGPRPIFIYLTRGLFIFGLLFLCISYIRGERQTIYRVLSTIVYFIFLVIAIFALFYLKQKNII